ncbi:hypothetical protein ES705_41809 [subsurface metagenome]|jgi:hypothetical protein
MAEKEKQLKVGDRVCDSYGRKGIVVRLGKHGAVGVKWDGDRQEIAESSALEKAESP